MLLEVLGLVGSTGRVGANIEEDDDPAAPLRREVELASAGDGGLDRWGNLSW